MQCGDVVLLSKGVQQVHLLIHRYYVSANDINCKRWVMTSALRSPSSLPLYHLNYQWQHVLCLLFRVLPLLGGRAVTCRDQVRWHS